MDVDKTNKYTDGLAKQLNQYSANPKEWQEYFANRKQRRAAKSRGRKSILNQGGGRRTFSLKQDDK